MISIRGRGIDRHLDVADSVAFPPTNLGNTAPTQTITVHNRGEAMLSITAVDAHGLSSVGNSSTHPPSTFPAAARTTSR